MANPELFQDPIIIVNWDSTKRISNEPYTIQNGKILLSGIPLQAPQRPVISYMDGSTKTYMTEAPDGARLSENTYRVDYTYGWVFFDAAVNGREITVDYNSRGYWLISEKRVWTKFSADGGVLETLDDLTKEIRSYRYLKEYDETRVYEQNNQVILNGTTYMAIKDQFKGQHPSNKEYWRVLAAGIGETAQWDNAATYYPRDTVQYNHGIYLMKDVEEDSTGKRPDLYPDIWAPLLSVKQIYDEWAILKPILEGYRYLDTHVPANTYQMNNQVLYNGTVYIAVQNVPANTPITNTSYWKVFSAGFGQTEDWSSAKAYHARDTVTYQHAVYVCLRETTAGIVPTNTTYWYQLVSVKQLHDDWAVLQPKLEGYRYLGVHNPASAYQLNNQVLYNGTVYIAKQAVPQNTAITNTSYWAVFAAGLGDMGEWSSSKAYDVRDTVTYQHAVYVCRQQAPAGTLPTNTTYWYEMVSVKQLHDDWAVLKPKLEGYQYRGAYAAGNSYQQNNQVLYNGTVYIATQNVPSSTPITNTSYWAVFAAGLGQTADWVNSKVYYARDTVTYQHAVYVCLQTAAAGTLPTNTTYWYEMVSVKQLHDDWATLKPAVQQATSDANAAATAANQAAETANQTNQTVTAAEAGRVEAEQARVEAEEIRQEFYEQYKDAIEDGPVLSVNGKTGIVTLGKDELGLGNVDNTSDMDKPVSTAVQGALDKKANEWIAKTSGSNTAYTVTLEPAPTELYAGMTITIIPHQTSNLPSATLNVNGLGAKNFRMRGYTTGSVYAPYTSSFLTASKPVTLTYDGTYWVIVGYSKPYWYDIQSRPSTFPPSSHKSSAETYGVGDSNNYGHVKLANNLATENTVTGTALDARQGKTLADNINKADGYLYTISDVSSSNVFKISPAYAHSQGTNKPLNEVITELQDEFDNKGGTIFLKPGNYYINAPIELETRVRLIGCGKGTVITRNVHQPAVVENCLPMVIVNSDCAVENIRFSYGNNMAGSAADDIVYPVIGTPSMESAVKNVTIRDVERETLYDSLSSTRKNEAFFYGALENSLISNCKLPKCTYGVILHASSKVTVECCDFSNSESGITIVGGSENVIRGNTVSNCDTGIDLTNTTNNTISENVANNSTGNMYPMNSAAISLRSGADYNIVEHNVVCDCTGVAPISSYYGHHNIIDGNMCARNKYGIYGGYHGIITNNYCLDNLSEGISASSRCTVSGNVCVVTDKAQVNSSYSGIALTGSESTMISVTGNTVIFGGGLSTDILSTQYTIRLSPGAKNCVVTGNSIMGKDVTDENTDTANKNLIINNKWTGNNTPLPVSAGGTGATSAASAPFLAKTGGTMAGTLTAKDTSSETKQVRNIQIGKNAPSSLTNGVIYLQYE